MSTNNEKDSSSTGTQTTGHEWDGIQELNNPLPTWWLYSWLVCIAWALVAFVLYPSFPGLTGYWHGVEGSSTRPELAAEMSAAQLRTATTMNKIAQLSVEDIAKNPQLLAVAVDDGQSAFANNCQPCHGAGGSGRKGFPVLASDAWLWGGTLDDIQQTITYGIRSGHPKARVSDMPHFGADGILTPDQIGHVADYVLFLAGKPVVGVDVTPGKAVFKDNCAVCHGDHGQGTRSVGAPRYFDRVFLYGENHNAIVRQVTMPHEGVMPAWTYRLDLATIKCLTLYVHSLGGGE